jgi:glycine cleavage system H protein
VHLREETTGMYPKELKYDKEHVWARIEGDSAVLGITHFAQEQLGEVVYVDLPSPGDEVVAGETFGEIESVKSVSELFSPVNGEITKVNEGLDDAPETVNEDCYGDGWMVEIALADASETDELLSAEEYEELVSEEG